MENLLRKESKNRNIINRKYYKKALAANGPLSANAPVRDGLVG